MPSGPFDPISQLYALVEDFQRKMERLNEKNGDLSERLTRIEARFTHIEDAKRGRVQTLLMISTMIAALAALGAVLLDLFVL